MKTAPAHIGHSGLAFMHLVFIFLHALLVTATVTGFAGLPPAWGVAHIALLPPWLWIAGYALLVAATVAMVGNPTAVAVRLSPSHWTSRLWLAVLLVLPLLTWSLRQKYALLGDGYVRADELDMGTMSSHGSFYLGLLHRVGVWLDTDGVTTLQLVSCALSIPFALMARAFAVGLTNDTRQRWQVMALVCTSAVVLFYFGYVEAYAPLPIALLAFASCGLQALKGSHLWLAAAAICLGVGILLHPVLAFGVPALVWLVGFRIPNTRWRTGWNLGMGLLILATLTTIAAPTLRRVVLPLTSEGLLSAEHLWERLNGMLLAIPAGVMVLLGVMDKRSRPAVAEDARLQLLALLAACGLAADLGLDFILGRLDWDLQALTLFPTLLLAAGIATALGPGARAMIAVATTCGMLNLAAWIAVNHTDLSFDLVARYLESEPAPYFRTHMPAGRFADYAKRAGQPTRAIPVLQRALDGLAVDDAEAGTDERARLHYYIGSCYFEARQYEPAAAAFRAALQENPVYALAFNMLLESWRALGQNEQAEVVRTRYLKELMSQTAAHSTRGDTAAAARGWLAIRELGGASASLFLEMGQTYQRLGMQDEARDIWQQGLERFPDNVQLQSLVAAGGR